jgi:hypothetical protein
MAGQPQPPRIVEAIAVNAGVGFINAIPITSANPLAMSLDQGFPPSNFLDPASGGVLPSGADMNGAFNLTSSWDAYLAAGQLPLYDAVLQTAMGGYAIGARIAKAADHTALWISTVDGNMTDPDTGGAGWLSSVPLYSAAALPGTNDVVLPGVNDYVIDIDTTSGARTITGFVAQRSWQKITLCTTGVNAVQYNPLTGSAANNQIRLSTGGIATLQNDSITFQYVPTVNKWVQV